MSLFSKLKYGCQAEGFIRCSFCPFLRCKSEIFARINFFDGEDSTQSFVGTADSLSEQDDRGRTLRPLSISVFIPTQRS